MSKSATILTACVLATGTALAAVGAGLEQHPWGRWQPGAWVETEIVPLESGKMLARETLVEAAEEGVRLHRSTRMSGPDGPVSVDSGMVLGYAFMGSAHLDPGREQIGTETLVVSGRRYPCTIWSAAGRIDKERSEETTWVARGVEYPLRIVTRLKGYEMTLDLVRLDDVFRVGGRRIACARYEGKLVAGDREDQVYQLRSSAVPGGLLRTEMRTRMPDGSIGVHSNTVVDFGTR